MNGCHYIAGEWREGEGAAFTSTDPATGKEIWKGKSATKSEVDAAVKSARKSFPIWSRLTLEERISCLRKFEDNLKMNQKEFAEIISKDTGKPLWESLTEVGAMMNKVSISIDAFQERCPDKTTQLGKTTLAVHHKPHGVVVVFGPFNFPGHLPNGHIVPALLAGNTVVLKGSEFTPLVSEAMVEFWSELPKGVLNLIQGDPQTGHHLVTHPQIDALFFTGSYRTGQALLNALITHPEKILALEMGGNNPLVITDMSDLEASAYLTIQSSFLTAGQRCTCARRLILVENKESGPFLKVLIQMASEMRIGSYTMQPEPFMGPVIHRESVEKLLTAQAHLRTQNGKCLLEMRQLVKERPFLTPGIMDVTDIADRKDEELFGPFLQLIRVPSLEAAIREANQTSYGLVASIITSKIEHYKQFYEEIRAGVINWNRPTTGASSRAPFGGIGRSGNHRPSAYYAADYCAYPVASLESEEITIPQEITPGIIL